MRTSSKASLEMAGLAKGLACSGQDDRDWKMRQRMAGVFAPRVALTVMGALVCLVSLFRAFAQTTPSVSPVTVESVEAGSVTLRLPALPAGATSFTLQRAAATNAVQAPPTANLQVWLKADAIQGLTSGAAVASWPDSSGHGQNASQTNTDFQPQWIANGFNGRPVVRMGGGVKFLSLPRQRDIRTAFVVTRHHTGSQWWSPILGSEIVQFHGGPDNLLFSDQYTPVELKNGEAYLNGQSAVPTQMLKPTSMSVISLVTTGPVSVSNLSTQPNTGDGRAWNGDYAEVLLYNSELSSSQRQSVENYLLTKYGLGAAPSSLTWTTIQSGLAGDATYQDTGLDGNTRYYYRCVAQSSNGDIESPVSSGTTLPSSTNQGPPDPPSRPTVLGTTPDSAQLQLPALPPGATSHTLQRGSENATYEPVTAGLKAWFKADAVTDVADGDKVATWPDSSGAQRNATQTNGDWRPTWVASGINGRPSIRFNGNAQFFTSSWAGPDDEGATFFIVAKGSNYQSLVHFQTDGSWIVYPWGANGNQSFIVSNQTGYEGLDCGLIPGEVNVGTAVLQPGNAYGLRTFRNGRLVARRSANTSLPPLGTFRIGTHQGLGEFPNADVSEILIYGSALSDNDREKVESYLARKYGVPTSHPQNLTWTSIATNQAAQDIHTDTGLNAGKTYWYRSLAVGPGGSTPGEAVAVNTAPEVPAAPAAPTFGLVGATRVEVIAPTLPERTNTLTLQVKISGQPDTSYSEVTTGLGAQSSYLHSGLTASTTYAFRYVAVGVGGSTPGTPATVTTNEVDPPAEPEAPSITAVTLNSVDLQMPALPERATSMSLQRAVAPAAASAPSISGNPKFWLKADALAGLANEAPISAWASSAGSVYATQSAVASRPKWIAGVLNGHPIARLDGIDDVVTFPAQENIRTVFVVTRHATGAQEWAPLLGTPNNQMHGSSGTNLFDGYHTWGSITNGKTYLNGELKAPLSLVKPTSFSVISLVTASPISVDSLSAQLGWEGRYWNGDFAEVLLYESPLSDANRQSVEGYLFNKYNLGAPSGNLSWTTIATNLSGAATFQDTGLDAATRYYYRAVAQGVGGSTAGKANNTTTAPAAPLAPEIEDLAATHLRCVAPTLPQGAISLTLQQKNDGDDNSLYVDIATGLTAGASTPVTGLTPLHTYRFRYLAVGVNGSTPGGVAVKTMHELDPPGVPDAPTVTAVASNRIDLQMPALPSGTNVLKLQRALAPIQVEAPPQASSKGLRVWLKADSIRGLANGSRISSWADSSGHDNPATQTDTLAQPTVITNAIGSRPAVHMDGVDDFLSIPPKESIRSAFVVVRHSTGSQDWAPLLGSQWNSMHGSSGTSLFDGYHTSSAVVNGQVSLNGQSIPALSLSKPTSFSLVSVVTTAPIAVNSLSAQLGWEGRYWKGDFAEVLLYEAALSAEDRQNTENYLMAKYGLGETPAGLNWTTIATDLPGKALYNDQPLDPKTHYYYRCVAVSTLGQTPGPATSAVTRLDENGPPDPPQAPTITSPNVPSIGLKLPPLSVGSTSHTVQRATQVTVTAPPTANLNLWLKADSLSELTNGASVGTWTDSSGNGHNGVQNDPNRRPMYLSSAIGGRPAVRFNGNGQYFLTNIVGPGGTEVTIFVVAKGTNYQSIVRYQGYRGNYVLYPWGGDTLARFAVWNDGNTGNALDTGFTSGAINVGTALWKANTVNGMRTYMNGRLVAQRNTNDSTMAVEPLQIGSYADGGGEFPTADVAEILIYNSALSDADRQSVESYLAAKYVPVMTPPAGLDWQDIATDKAGLAAMTNGPVSVGTTYWYRCVGVGPGGSTPGEAVCLTPQVGSVQTPDAPGVPTFTDIASTSLKVVAPQLPARADSLTLQKKLSSEADTAYVDVATRLAGESVTPVAQLIANTSYRFRFVAVGTGGSTPGESAEATTLDASGGQVTAAADSYTVEENDTLTVAAPGVLGNDTGLQGQTLIAIEGSGPAHGTLALQQDGSFVYTPQANFHGSDSFTYQAKSGQTISAAATVSITITEVTAPPSNTAPVANAQSISAAVNTQASGTVTGSDANEDDLTFEVVDQPGHGSVVMAMDGSFVYDPATDYEGTDSFTFTANDGKVDSTPATVSITVGAPDPNNTPPTAQEASFTIRMNLALPTTIHGTDAENDVLTYVVVTGPQHGTLSGTAPTLTYTPAQDYLGEDSFTFKVNDGQADSEVVTVSLTVTDQNSAPVAQGAVFTTPENAPLNGQLHALDADHDDLTFELVDEPERGEVVLNPDGTFVYTPDPHSAYYYDPFSFKVSDQTHESEVAWVYIDITDVNDAPEAEDGEHSTLQNQSFQFSLLAHDFDPDVLNYSLVTQPQHGTISGFSDGPAFYAPQLTYTPSPDFTGTDTLTFKVNDGQLDSNVATITINVEPVESQPSSGFDALIREGASGDFIGNGIYNNSAAGQTVEKMVATGTAVQYQVQVQNEGSEPRALIVKGSATSNGWALHYFDAATGGQEITSAISGAEGWTTPFISAEASLTVRVEIEPTLTAAAEKEVSVSVFGIPPEEELFEDEVLAHDTVKVIARYVQPYRPDAWIEVTKEPVWTSYNLGDNLYLADGDDANLPVGDPNHAGQTSWQSKASGLTASYFITAQNDGALEDRLRLKGPAGSNGWEVHYFDARNAGQDITGEITGNGWLTPVLQSGESQVIRVEVTSGATTPFNSAFPVAVQVDSESAQSLSALRDVVTAVTTREHIALDLTIHTVDAENLPTAILAGKGIRNDDGEDQALTQNTYSRRPVSFLVGTESVQEGVSIRYTAPAGDSDWTVRYFFGNDEITAQITGAGWEHAFSSASKVSSNFEDMTTNVVVHIPIRVEVTPVNTIGIAADRTLLIHAAAVGEPTAVDAVQAIVHREPAIDASIRPAHRTALTGVGVHNTDATNQTVGFSQAHLQGTGTTAVFHIQVENHGNASDTFLVKAPASGNGWTLHYFDAPVQGTEITSALTSQTGWTSASTEPGEAIKIRLEATPDATASGEVYSSALIQATSVLDATATDAVKATYGFQRIAKLQYTLDQGLHWIDAPTIESGNVIHGLAKQTVGFRAVRLDESQPWPFEPKVKPMWDEATYWKTGETVWIRCGAATNQTQTVVAECGNTVSTIMDVVETYRVSLDYSKAYIPLGGGSQGSVTLSAKVTDSNGQPVAGKTVRFISLFDEDNSVAGEIQGAGSGDDSSTTDAQGIATVTLHSGARAGAVSLQAILVQNGVDSVTAREQAVVFGLLTTEPVEPEPNI